MKIIKSVLSVLLCSAMALTLLSCTGNGGETTATTGSAETPSSTQTPETTQGTKDDGTTALPATSAPETTAPQTTENPDNPDTPSPITPESLGYARERTYLKVGSYVTVIYDESYCTLTSSYEKGVGSKESVTMTVTMKDGYIFNGFTKGNGEANGAQVLENGTTYTFSTNEETTVYVNYSMTVVYHANGGKTSDGKDELSDEYSLVLYHNPKTLPATDYFVRDGYTLVEYNTKADGSGEAYSIGSRAYAGHNTKIDLYCVWAKQNDASDFKYTEVSGKIAITEYTGSSSKVVVPDKIDGKTVAWIYAFENTENVEEIVLPQTILTVRDGAFEYSEKLTTLTFFDSIQSIEDGCISGCDEFSNLRINYTQTRHSWTNSDVKYDRLLWARDMKKMILFGGSGTINGYDCDAIAEEFGDEYVIINYGSNANYTTSVAFDTIYHFSTSEDIIVWAPESGAMMFGDIDFSRSMRLFCIGGDCYDFLRWSDMRNYYNPLSPYARYVRDCTRKLNFGTFDASVNEFGDSIAVRVHKGTFGGYNFRAEWNFPYDGCAYLSSVIDKLNQKGVKVYHSFAAMDASGFIAAKQNDAAMEWYKNKIASCFPDVTFISDYHNYLIPTEMVYDSEWHLTNEGAEYRTQFIIADLKAQFAKEK